jgi:hypothetical protein
VLLHEALSAAAAAAAAAAARSFTNGGLPVSMSIPAV